MKMRIPLLLTVLAITLAGCATLPPRNIPLGEFDPAQGYRFSNIQDPENSDSLFVILTFSGGGTRAAALAYGVLEKLAQTNIQWEGKTRRLLDEVDVISSVSGGSLTAAYYGLYGDQIFEDFPDRVLYQNFHSGILDSIFSNLMRLRAPNFSRTDVMADLFDTDVYDRQTYADLIARNRRPFIIVNATNMSLGSRFPFIQDQFDLIYSDIAQCPVGYAVAASAAFPGLLSPVTLRNYPKPDGYHEPAWFAEALKSRRNSAPRYDLAASQHSYLDEETHPYIHLIDGGVSDNLGILGVIEALDTTDSPWSLRPLIDRGAIRKVVVITVNAKPGRTSLWDLRPNTPKLAPVLSTASTTPMEHFTAGMIEYFKLKMHQWTEATRFREQMKQTLAERCPDASMPDQAAPPPDYYFIEVAFDWLQDPERREYFSRIPTALHLPPESVDDLRNVATELLDQDPAFNTLLEELK